MDWSMDWSSAGCRPVFMFGSMARYMAGPLPGSSAGSMAGYMAGSSAVSKPTIAKRKNSWSNFEIHYKLTLTIGFNQKKNYSLKGHTLQH